MPTSGTRPSTALPTSGARPSKAMPTSGLALQRHCRLRGSTSTALPTSGARPSTATAYFRDSALQRQCLLRGLGLQRHCLLLGLGLQRHCRLQGLGLQRRCRLQVLGTSTATAYLQVLGTSTAMPTSGTRPSTALPTSGTRPSTAMPTSGTQDSTSPISSATQFNKEAQFNDAQFTGTANFNNSQFTGDALFENTTFQSKLSLTRARYDKLFIRWYNIKGGLVYDDAAYMSLMKNFKDLGYFEDYDSCYFQYRKEHRGQPWPAVNGWEAGIRKVIDYPLEWFYGYGTKPLNAFLFSLGIIISFGGFWRALGLGGPKDRTKEESKGRRRMARWRYYGYSWLQRHSLPLRHKILHRSPCHPKNRRAFEISDKEGIRIRETIRGTIFDLILYRCKWNDSESNLSEGSQGYMNTTNKPR